jgi:DNA-binding response OmpR family regulator
MRKRILIVDDEDNIRELTRLALEAAGYEVGEAANGLEAFAIIGGDDTWDVVLLDQMMPGLMGTEVLRRLKVMMPKTRVVMMTAFASVDLAAEAMKLGALDFVRKPMTPETLRNSVSAALAKPSAWQHRRLTYDAPAQITLNGFAILTLRNNRQESNTERSFLVRAPNGQERQVVVAIAAEAIAGVKEIFPDLPSEQDFWTEQAKQFLSAFIWNDGSAPASGRITLKGVDREAVQELVRKKVSK